MGLQKKPNGASNQIPVYHRGGGHDGGLVFPALLLLGNVPIRLLLKLKAIFLRNCRSLLHIQIIWRKYLKIESRLKSLAIMKNCLSLT